MHVSTATPNSVCGIKVKLWQFKPQAELSLFFNLKAVVITQNNYLHKTLLPIMSNGELFSINHCWKQRRCYRKVSAAWLDSIMIKKNSSNLFLKSVSPFVITFPVGSFMPTSRKTKDWKEFTVYPSFRQHWCTTPGWEAQYTAALLWSHRLQTRMTEYWSPIVDLSCV